MPFCPIDDDNELYESRHGLEKEGLRDQVKVMVGGAPVNELFANQIGADGYSGNANAAVIKAKELLCIA